MDFDVEYDVVVVGGGASGKSAAYTVATESDLSVAVLEKMEETGGSGVYAEGTAAAESSEQKARTKVDYYGGDAPEGAHYPSCQELYQRYIDYSHHRANPDVAKAFAYNSAETIDIFKKLGVEFTDVVIYAYDQPNELYTFHRPDGLGAREQELLLRGCVNEGVDIFTSTPAKSLIMEDGVVKGLVATDADGNEMKIGAKAVILASGGMGNNMEMVGKYSWIPDIAKTNHACVPTQNTGDGIRMAIDAGADTRALGTLMIMSTVPDHTLGCQLHAAGSQPVLWVDRFGKRFCNEIVAMSFADAGNINALTDGGVMFPIMDSDYVEYLKKEGSEIGLGDFVPYGSSIDFEGELEESLAAHDGAAFKADSIEELAEMIGADKDTLTATVKRYNELAEKGDDEDYFKPAKFLRTIKKAPFYAIKMVPSILVSDGGIRVNGDMQVTDKSYEPIAGLYAVGNEASGLYGDTYNLDCPGSANGFAHTSGRLAARHAIKTING
ncbi:MAG: FAD-dependent oxidoreductase [Coriobacteriales bacterium]|jgi:fumarate reductase flavoprotein subunit